MKLPWVDRLWTWIRYSWWGQILAEHHTEPTELIMGGFLKCIVGIWLLLPMNSFAASPTFASLIPIPEIGVALFLMTFGILHITSLKAGDTYWRMRSSQGGAIIWFALSFSFIVLNPPAFGAMLFLTAAISQTWCYVRLSHPVRSPA